MSVPSGEPVPSDKVMNAFPAKTVLFVFSFLHLVNCSDICNIS